MMTKPISYRPCWQNASALSKVLSLINRAAYVDLVESGSIDIALSPQQATIGSLLAHIRRGDIVAVHSLRRGAAEALEAIAHGDKDSSLRRRPQHPLK